MTARRWDTVRRFALELPGAVEDFPWGECVVKVEKKRAGEAPPWRRHLVHGPMFLWLGRRDAEAPSVSVKLTVSYDAAVALARATPTTISGLGQWGWLTVDLAATETDLVCDWVEESYRNVAPRRLIAELNASPGRGSGS